MNNEYIISGGCLFWFSKRIFDIVFSISLIPILIILTIFLFLFNRFYNKGPIFFIQKRMGKNCKPFFAVKFRSMIVADNIDRKHNDPVEIERVTPLGKIIRRIRFDEIPQIINVIKGDMSLIGPRPDYFEHAKVYVKTIQGSEGRHIIRPGISGLSQIRLGYAEGMRATKAKANVDKFYIENAGFLLDTKILFGTIFIIFRIY